MPAYHAEPALTPREREILCCLLRGNELRDVAGQLVISLNTVKTHLSHLFGKSGTHSQRALVIWAVDHRSCCVLKENHSNE